MPNEAFNTDDASLLLRSVTRNAVSIMRFLSILICSMAVGSFLGGCSSQDEVVTNSRSSNKKIDPERAPQVSAPEMNRKQVIVFRGKYYKTTGPCIQLGDALGMPMIDAFEVAEVLEGNLKAKTIDVRAMTEGGSSYPKEMVEGKIYTLRLTPSDKTTKQLRENENKEDDTFLWIDGDEIEEQKATK